MTSEVQLLRWRKKHEEEKQPLNKLGKKRGGKIEKEENKFWSVTFFKIVAFIQYCHGNIEIIVQVVQALLLEKFLEKLQSFTSLFSNANSMSDI